MILTTRKKLAIARVLSRVVVGTRALLGRPARTQVIRQGLRWSLDLGEGFDLAIYLGANERSTLKAYRQLVKPGATVLDIGANIGAHTLVLARLVGTSGSVIAFEPTRFAFGKLRANIDLNPDLAERIWTEQIMLVAEESTALSPKLYASWPLDGGKDVHPKLRGRLSETTGATAETLDGYATRTGLNRVDLIKLDVDGHEGDVLAGAENLLRANRPVIVMELCPYLHAEQERTFADLVAMIKDLGYGIFQENSGKPLPDDPQRLDAMIPDGGGINAILTPLTEGRSPDPSFR